MHRHPQYIYHIMNFKDSENLMIKNSIMKMVNTHCRKLTLCFTITRRILDANYVPNIGTDVTLIRITKKM